MNVSKSMRDEPYLSSHVYSLLLEYFKYFSFYLNIISNQSSLRSINLSLSLIINLCQRCADCFVSAIVEKMFRSICSEKTSIGMSQVDQKLFIII